MPKKSLRTSESILIAYFGYVALITPLFADRPHLNAQPFYELGLIALILLLLVKLERIAGFATPVGILRDWLPLLFTLIAFREMELFLPRRYPHHYEAVWVRQDHVFLARWHFLAIIESLGKLIPWYLELCYLLVYALGPACIGIFYAFGQRDSIDRFLTIYLLGTLLAYSLFPYFPSEPPRIAFPDLDLPHVSSWIRQLNLFVLKKGTIHLGVFPSAHVSCAFSAAWAFFITMPQRKLLGWLFLFYACSVSLATIYGRYHYVADVVAGFAVSLLAIAIYQLLLLTLAINAQTSERL